MGSIISDYLSKLEFGELKVFNNMAIFPLLTSINESLQYLTLKEALEKRLLTITEVSQSGSVPELKVVNKAEIPVLLLDGEELAGGKAKQGFKHNDTSQGKFRDHYPCQLHRTRKVGLRIKRI